MINKYPTLYSFRRCPYAMRARLALRLCKIECIIREISLKAKNIEFLKVSPKGTVPVLVLPNGKVLEESLDIINWSLEQNDPNNLKVNDEVTKKINDKYIQLFDKDFKFHLDRYKYSSRYNISNSEIHRNKARNILTEINTMLEGKDYIGGQCMSLLDISILPFVRQYRIADINWFDNHLGLRNINNWVNIFLNTEILASIMTKYKVWEKEDPPILF
jgi:glutathione S-transferase